MTGRNVLLALIVLAFACGVTAMIAGVVAGAVGPVALGGLAAVLSMVNVALWLR